MKRSNLICTVALLAIAGSPQADILELRSGAIVDGVFAGGSQSTIRFETDGRMEVIPVEEIIALTFTGSRGMQNAYASPSPPPQPTSPVLSAGSRVLVRMTQSIDSQRHGVGHRFTARLEGAIVANGTTIAPAGSTVYGVLTSASKSGRVAGSSELTVTLTDVRVGDELRPITTSSVRAQGQATGADTVGRTARWAAVGALSNGSKGAKRGARAGAGVSLLTSGKQVNIPSGTILEFQTGADFRG